MRIVTWNCCMAWGRKSERILALQPDIVVLQECSERDARASGATHTFWTGSNPHKGLAVLVFGDVKASLHPCATTSLPWFLPVTIDRSLRLLAIWASVKSNQWRYVRVAHRILDCSEVLLRSRRSLAIGDFNSNAIFDRKHGQLTHTHLVERLGSLGLRSAYHMQSGEPHGEETTPTQYMYRHPDKPFHLDYAFVSKALMPGTSLTIGDPGEWLAFSDHMPLLVEF